MLRDVELPYDVLDDIEEGGSCATKISNAFNRAGYGDVFNDAPAGRIVTDSNGNKYLLGAAELAEQLGIGWRYHTSNQNAVQGKQGIIYFENYHIDLWDGSKMVGNDTSGFYDDKKAYFMELK